MTTRANPCGAATTWVVSANTWHVACFGFLQATFFLSLFLESRCAIARRPILTIYMSRGVFPRKDVPLGHGTVSVRRLYQQMGPQQQTHCYREVSIDCCSSGGRMRPVPRCQRMHVAEFQILFIISFIFRTNHAYSVFMKQSLVINY